MRSSLRGITGLVATGLFSLTAITAANAAVERQLLGVKIWNTYKDVLARHGQPSRIEIGAVENPMDGGGGGGAQTTAAPRAGGLPGMGSMGMGGGSGSLGVSGMGAGGGPSAGGGGMMGMMGAQMQRSRQMSAQMGGGGTGSMGGMSQMMSGYGAPGGGGRRGGPPGMGGPGGGGGMLGAPMGSGGGMGMGGGGSAASDDEGEITWIYDKGPLTYMFLFNKDGRVIQISEYGYASPFGTEHGVKLGDPVSKVYSIYGWSGQTSKSGSQLTLDYSNGQHVAFQLLSQGKGARVVGIVVALAEKTHILGRGAPAGAGMYGAPGMGGGGLPGFGGLPGMGGGKLGGGGVGGAGID